MGRNAKPEFVVKKSTLANSDLNWFIIGRPNGQRVRAWFASKERATAEATERNLKIRKLGQESAKIDYALMAMATEGATALLLHKKTVRDAVNFYLAHLTRTSASVSFSVLAQEFRSEIARRLLVREKMSQLQANALSSGVHKLELQFGSRIVAEITPQEAETWAKNLPLAPRSKINIVKIGRQIFAFAMAGGRAYTAVNPFKTVQIFEEDPTEENEKVHVLTADQTSRLLNAADKSVIPFLAFWFFCGIRRASLERLKWSDVNFAEKRVIVPGYAGKLKKRYPVTMHDNLLEWLKPYVTAEGSLLALDRNGKANAVLTRKLVLRAAKKAGIVLPDNVGRHTFISMHVERYENAHKTAKEANNSAGEIEESYRHLVSKADAAKFWQIMPPGQPDNVVPMDVAA
jgi:integrase